MQYAIVTLASLRCGFKGGSDSPFLGVVRLLTPS